MTIYNLREPIEVRVAVQQFQAVHADGSEHKQIGGWHRDATITRVLGRLLCRARPSLR